MELALLKLVAMARPLASMEFNEALFAIVGVGLFGLLVVALLIRAALTTQLRISGIDCIVAAFTVWCIAISGIYFESVRVGEVAKLIIPLMSYSLVKNVVRNEKEYNAVLFWIIVGFVVPTLLSAGLIATGNKVAIDMVNYWTSVTRWQGVYNHSHTLGHSMTLLLMVMVVWFTLTRRASADRHGPGALATVALGVLGLAALYCLYMSQVRSALLGLLTFLGIYLFHYNRRVLMFGAVAIAAVAVLSVPYWLPELLPEFSMRQHGIEVSNLDLGSGRPRFWLNDITVYGKLPIDQKLGGVGIGANEQVGDGEMLYGHNDWLGMLTQTGLIGLLLFAALQVAILKRILKLQDGERHMFVALFVAVNVMMMVSNSYAWRIQVSQLYYMMLAFIEIASTETRARVPTMQGVHA